ncbi:NAD(P)-dependent oxidoreductase [Chitinophaga rhizophila]|uniref:NAD(P)-binding domain-containing protein n=1 Tax=Chitinophaga rhizophila TaxID=2866212 RepID=A0ABS7G5B0_9BACT|nr:NAD(P)-binding domain-containing protein [Chitinophaga rhizophila]MBW8682822.1 NAD(P)-binding domain-containing protein [Chitinophaga rhizophila]
MTTTTHLPAVAVIGAGMMGATLARLLLDGGYTVTVWNRTTEKTVSLVAAGAHAAADPARAIQQAEIVVVCVHDYQATMEIFNYPGVSAALDGKLIIQLTSGSPQEAAGIESWSHQQGAQYIDGAIQAGPSQMGRPDTPILVSGAATAYERALPLLQAFGGGLSWLGEKVSLAAAMDLATLSYIYGTTLGFFHGIRVVESAGLPVDHFGELVAGIAPSFGEFLQHQGNVVHSGDYSISQSPLSISVDAVERILQQAREAGINDEFPRYAASLFRRAAAAGYNNQEVAAVVKVLRSESLQSQ